MKILIANRGEIAERIHRAAQSLGVEIQTVYARNERAPAPDAIELPLSGAAAYLDIAAILQAALDSNCTHVHPGYGFLSESHEFARACENSGLTFIGPDAEALKLFGNKSAAREHAHNYGVPTLAATRQDASLEEVREFATHHPEGIMIKARSGGGGRGMRRITAHEDISDAYESCRSEAKRAFGDEGVYAEKLLSAAKHIEIQAMGDGSGTVSILGERECSVQRRNQKIIEFAPSPSLNQAERNILGEHARRLLEPLRYQGLATVEFLVAAESLGTADGRTMEVAFIEVNPRIQVEHTITEEITGIDLLTTQLRLADGETLESLGLPRAFVPQNGLWSVQCRINAEHLANGILGASTGTITSLTWPPATRVDTHLHKGLVIDGTFDSLIAKLVTRTEGDWCFAVQAAAHALNQIHIEGIETNLSFLAELLADEHVLNGSITTNYVDSLHREEMGVPEQDWTTASETIVAPCAGTVVRINASAGDVLGPQSRVITIEAMKMEYPIRAGATVQVNEILVSPGQQVITGEVLATLRAAEAAEQHTSSKENIDLGTIRPDLAEVLERRRALRDEARPAAVEKRHSRGHLMPREWLDLLVDPGSFHEYGSFPVAAQRSRRSLDDLIDNTPADGIVTGVARVDTHEVAILAYDYTVLAGTQGYFNHLKTDRMLSVAKSKQLPVILFAEGGGGRPGDTDAQHLIAAGLTVPTFAMMGSLSGHVPTIGILTGRSFAGNAALLGCCDVIIATKDSNLGMAGPAMIAGGGLGEFTPEQIGPMSVQGPNGVVDIVVENDQEAIGTAKKYLSYFTEPVTAWCAADQRLLRHSIGENRKEIYDARTLITTLCDSDSVLELRAGFAPGIITALVRVEGKAYGLLANDPAHLGGAINADGADKMARFMQLCDAHGLPLISLCDTPGFMVGPESEESATVRHFSRLFVIGSHLRVPILTIVLRKGYGLGAQAMAGGSFRNPVATLAWPTGEIGGMGLEGAVRLGYAKELLAITNPMEQLRRFDELVAQHYEAGKALNGAMLHELDEVIDPAESRTWITSTLGGFEAITQSGRYIDTW